MLRIWRRSLYIKVLSFMGILHVVLYWPFKNSGFIGFLHWQLLANGPLALVLVKVTCIVLHKSYSSQSMTHSLTDLFCILGGPSPSLGSRLGVRDFVSPIRYRTLFSPLYSAQFVRGFCHYTLLTTFARSPMSRPSSRGQWFAYKRFSLKEIF